MDKDLILFYLLKIEGKAKVYFLQSSEAARNDLLMYLEICIEVCNMLEKSFYKKVDAERRLFQDIQGNVLVKDIGSVLNMISGKKKELESSRTVSSSK